MQQERTRVRTEQEARYHTLQEKNSELQNRLYTLEVVYTKQNEEEIKQRRVEFDIQLEQWFHKVTVLQEQLSAKELESSSRLENERSEANARYAELMERFITIQDRLMNSEQAIMSRMEFEREKLRMEHEDRLNESKNQIKVLQDRMMDGEKQMLICMDKERNKYHNDQEEERKILQKEHEERTNESQSQIQTLQERLLDSEKQIFHRIEQERKKFHNDQIEQHEKIRKEYDDRLNESNSQVKALQDRMLDGEKQMLLCMNKERNDQEEERRKLCKEKLDAVQEYQEKWMLASNEIVYWKEQLASMEKVTKIEIIQQTAMEVEGRLKEESALFTSTMKAMEQKVIETEKELVKMSESKIGLEKLMDMSVRDGINNALSEYTQRENIRFKLLEDELQLTKEKLTNELVINEEKRHQEVNEELLEQKKQLEVLTTELTVQKQQVDEIKEAKHASSIIGRIGEATFSDLAQQTFCTYEGFDLVDTSKIPHSGDFELTFQDTNGTINASLILFTNLLL